jgi:HEAT repeat protein
VTSNAATRAETAFALGQQAQNQTTNLLLQRLSEEKDLEVRLALIEAISKTASDSSIFAVSEAITSWLSDQIPIIRAEAALAAGRLAQRGFKKMEWSASLSHLLGDADEEVRWGTAYALFRLHSGNPEAPDSLAAGRLTKALDDRSARVRMQAARALGEMKTTSALEPLTNLAQKDSDWRVRQCECSARQF